MLGVWSRSCGYIQVHDCMYSTIHKSISVLISCTPWDFLPLTQQAISKLSPLSPISRPIEVYCWPRLVCDSQFRHTNVATRRRCLLAADFSRLRIQCKPTKSTQKVGWRRVSSTPSWTASSLLLMPELKIK